MKLTTSIKGITKVVKDFKIGTSRFKLKAKEQNHTTTNTKDIILIFRAFHIYMQIFIFIATSNNKLLL